MSMHNAVRSTPAPPLWNSNMEFDRRSDPNFARLNDALRDLRTLHPLAKPRLIKGCAACALTDGATSSERALLIGIAATLDCPLPPDLAI